MKKSGVYKITNKVTGESYIGSSRNVMKRWSDHKCPSTWESRPGMLIYQAFQEYGLENFNFEIIEETDNLKNREQYFIGLLKPKYNMLAASTGMSREEYKNQYQRQYQKSEKGKEVSRKGTARYQNRLCEYNGEILTLHALGLRFYKVGIEHPVIEAKKYLIESDYISK